MELSGVRDSGQTATELRTELQRLVRDIVDDDDCSIEKINRAIEILNLLKDIKFRKRSVSLRFKDTADCPEEFKCPLSNERMKDPVVVSSGATYDRPFIQRWLKSGNLTCPQTQQVLSHTMLTPNHLVRDMISEWCKSQGIELLDPVDYTNEEGITQSERDHFLSLLEKMSLTIPEQKAAAKDLRVLTKRMPSFRTLFGEYLDAIPQLLSPLSLDKSQNEVYPGVQEDVITTLLNLSIHDSNKKLVAETPSVIPVLMEALRSGTIQTRSNAAAAIFTLSALDSNKVLIGKSGALEPLIDLLEEGHPPAMKDVASAIFNLCIDHDNKARAVQDGAIKVLLDKIMNNVLVDELLAILAMLSSHQKAVEELQELGAVPCLLRIMRESSCARIKENCIATLCTICQHDRTVLKEMRKEENLYDTISDLAKSGTPRAKRKATAILERLNRVNMHTA